jgi:hypothetical protein
MNVINTSASRVPLGGSAASVVPSVAWTATAPVSVTINMGSAVTPVTGSETGAWAIYVARQNTSASKINFNNSAAQSVSWSSTNTRGVSLGATFSGTVPCNCEFAELAFWTSLLSDNEVAGLLLSWNAKYLIY